MSILFSGDFHANAVNELNSITKEALIQKYGEEKFSGINFHVILGDGGFMWQNNQAADQFNYAALALRPFPVLCVIGNHEPILGMDGLPETDIGIGETVHQICDAPFVAYFKRGKIYNINGFKILVLGGALSIDKIFRKPGKTWWELEYWTEREKSDVFELLKTENTFDFVLSHTGPQKINQKLFRTAIGGNSKKFTDEVALLNDEIEKRINFREWWCGHFHENVFFYDEEKGRGYQYLYKMTKIIDRVNGEAAVYNEFDASKR